MNEAGQFVIGTSNRINYENTVDFIKNNYHKSIELYKNYVKLTENVRKLQEKVELKLKCPVTFDSGLNFDQKLITLRKLDEYLNSDKAKTCNFSALNNTNLNIATYYCVNDNGTAQIPWNWFINE